jgi:predicted nucleotidyltransferase
VEIDKDISLLDFVGIKLEIEEKLGRKVDLVEYSTIKPLLKENILKEEVGNSLKKENMVYINDTGKY